MSDDLNTTIEKIRAGEKFTPIQIFKNDDEARRYFDAIAVKEKRLTDEARAKAGATEAEKTEAHRQRIVATQKADALKNWCAAGGDASTFDAAWPQIQQRILIDAASTKPTAPPAFRVKF